MRDRSIKGKAAPRGRTPFRRDPAAPRERPRNKVFPSSAPAPADSSPFAPAPKPFSFPAIEKTTILLTRDDAGRRLDVVVNEKLAAISRRIAKDLIAIGAVWVNETRVKTASRIMAAGDVIVIHRPADLSAMPGSAPETHVVILHEDETILVVDKPAGLPVQGTPAQDFDTLSERVRRHVSSASRSPHRAYAGLMHRLDRFASGAVVFSKSKLVNRDLARQFSEHTIRREYLALVRGIVPDDAFERRTHIRWDPKTGARVSTEAGEGQVAVTRFRVEERFERHTWIRVLPQTGRTHQIRIHLADVSHPIVSDPVYGDPSGIDDDHLLVPRLALHAHILGFVHPLTRRTVLVTSPLPPDVADAVSKLRSSGERTE